MILYVNKTRTPADSADTSILLRYALLQAGFSTEAERAVTETGKPYFPVYPDFHFSLCHCEHFALCAVDNAPVGVDMEFVRPLRQNIAARYFAPEEQVLISREPALFFDFWVIREALAKATGLGLSGVLSHACIDWENSLVTGVDGSWSFALCPPLEDNYRLAVCHAGKCVPQPTILRVSTADLANIP